MNKTELVAAMAKETNLSKKDVEAVLKSFTDVVASELKKLKLLLTNKIERGILLQNAAEDSRCRKA